MNPPNPFLQPKNNPRPEDKFRGLIITGNVIAILIIIASLFITAYTIRKSRMSRMVDEMQNDIAMMDTAMPDAVVDDGSSSYSNYSAEYQEGLNDQTALELRLLLRDTTSNRDAYISSLNTIQTSTDEMCSYLRTLADEYIDSTANMYSYNESEMTTHFFIKSGRGASLLMQLHSYRSTVISAVDQLGTGNESMLKQSLPLDDSYANSYTVAWDNEKLQGSSYDALEYLKSIETEIRNFEATAFNRFPRTY